MRERVREWRQAAGNLVARALQPLPFYLEWRRFLRSPAARPDATWLNAVLATRRDWEQALEQVKRLGLPPHHDPPKNWDSLAAIALILQETDETARILDAGATLASVVLPWLSLYGYRDLWGINLSFRRPRRRGPIRYERGDITRTRFAPGTFDVVTCLSVIEHGVDPGAYFAEAVRILKPGGLLLTSTDYWPEPIPTGKLIAFGAPLHVFTRQELEELLRAAAGCGLRLTDPLDLRSQDKAVSWKKFGLDYTFVLFTMRKDASAT